LTFNAKYGAVSQKIVLFNADVSEEYIASISRVEEYAEQETSAKAGSTENRSDMFLRNVG
jgi:hypothetical protein